MNIRKALMIPQKLMHIRVDSRRHAAIKNYRTLRRHNGEGERKKIEYIEII